MNNILNRIISAFRVLFLRRVFVIEVTFSKKMNKDVIAFSGTDPDLKYQIEILRALADSIEIDLKQQQLNKKHNFKPLNN